MSWYKKKFFQMISNLKMYDDVFNMIYHSDSIEWKDMIIRHKYNIIYILFIHQEIYPTRVYYNTYVLLKILNKMDIKDVFITKNIYTILQSIIVKYSSPIYFIIDYKFYKNNKSFQTICYTIKHIISNTYIYLINCPTRELCIPNVDKYYVDNVYYILQKHNIYIYDSFNTINNFNIHIDKDIDRIILQKKSMFLKCSDDIYETYLNDIFI